MLWFFLVQPKTYVKTENFAKNGYLDLSDFVVLYMCKNLLHMPFTSWAIFRSWHHFLFLDNIKEKNQLSFEYF